MKNRSTEEEYQRLLEGDSSDLHEILTAFLESGDGIVIADENGIIKHVNPAYEKMSGYLKEELIGKTPHVISSGLQSEKFYKDMRAKLLAGQIFRGEFINRRKNGSLYFQSETIAPVKDNSGKVIGFVSSGRDTTAEFYQEKKFSLFGKISSSVLLKELRDPILRTRAAAVRLREFATKSKNLQVLKDLEMIYTTNRQMEHTLDVLREFFYPSFDKDDSVDVEDIIGRALETAESRFTKPKILFEATYEDDLPRVKLPGKLWEFVFEELLHHYGSAARGSKEKTPKVSISVRPLGRDIVVNIDGGAGTPVNSRGACDKACGCIWVDDTDLKFVLMEIVIIEAGGIVHHEQIDENIFRTTLVIPIVL